MAGRCDALRKLIEQEIEDYHNKRRLTKEKKKAQQKQKRQQPKDVSQPNLRQLISEQQQRRSLTTQPDADADADAETNTRKSSVSAAIVTAAGGENTDSAQKRDFSNLSTATGPSIAINGIPLETNAITNNSKEVPKFPTINFGQIPNLNASNNEFDNNSNNNKNNK